MYGIYTVGNRCFLCIYIYNVVCTEYIPWVTDDGCLFTEPTFPDNLPVVTNIFTTTNPT